MTTKEKVREQVIALLDEIRPHLEKKLNEVLESGCINFDELPDNWKAPKELFVALMREAEFQNTNIHASRKDKKQIEEYTRLVRLSGMYYTNDDYNI